MKKTSSKPVAHNTSASAKNWSYRPELDGLRFVAVSLVLLFHTQVSTLSAGFIGVDLFFVLSGFLVCGVILAELDRNQKFSLFSFYARRIRRLLPAAVVVGVATCALLLITTPQTTRVTMIDDARAALLNYANWHFIFSSNDYFDSEKGPSAFTHFWSLSVEEQYYFVFPIFVAVGVWVNRWRVKKKEDPHPLLLSKKVETFLFAVCILGLGASVALQIQTATTNSTMAYYGTHTRVYQLLAGALLCLIVRKITARKSEKQAQKDLETPPLASKKGTHALRLSKTERLLGYIIGLFTLGAISGFVLLATDVFEMSASLRGFAAAAVAVLILAGLTMRPKSMVGGVLSLKSINYLGKISYGTYLWHWPVMLLFTSAFQLPAIVLFTLVFIISSGLAAASFEILETPIRKNTWLEKRKTLSIGLGVTASIGAAIGAAPALMNLHTEPAAYSQSNWAGVSSQDAQELAITNPLENTEPGTVLFEEGEDEGSVAAAERSSIGAAILPDGWTDPVPDEIDLTSYLEAKPDSGPECFSTDIQACVAVEGKTSSALHVVLIGDSHAGMYRDALIELAQEEGFKLSTALRIGCPWQPKLASSRGSDGGAQECIDNREDFYQNSLPKMDADIVLAITKARTEGVWRSNLVIPDSSEHPGESFDEMMLRKVEEGADLVAEAGAELVIMKSTFGTVGYDDKGFSPLACLDAADTQSECAVIPPAVALMDSFYDTVATQRDDVWTLDMRSVYCPSVICGPIIDGVVVWRDAGHLSTAFTTQNKDQLWDRLKATGLTR